MKKSTVVMSEKGEHSGAKKVQPKLPKPKISLSEKGEHSGAKKVQPKLPKPKITLSELLFVIYVETDKRRLGFVTRGKDLKIGSNDRFHIQTENFSHLRVFKFGMSDVRIKWEVIYKPTVSGEYIFDVRRSLDTNVGWLFNNLLPPKGLTRSGLVADVKASFYGEFLDNIGLEVFQEHDGRYYSVDDTLRYLQRFFLKH